MQYQTIIGPSLSRVTAISCLLLTISIAPAIAASLTFAQYVQADGAQQQWSITTTAGITTVQASGAVAFTFSGVPGLPFAGARNATFTLNATSSQPGNCGVACGAGDSFVQPGYAGTFSFIDTLLGTNLLSGTFAVTGSPATTGAQFSSSVGSSGGSFNASATAGNLNQLIMTSAYLNLAGQTQENASWGLSSLTPNFSTGAVTAGRAFPAAGPFSAAGSGTFSSNPGPIVTPEPDSMALIGGGLLAIGLLRRKMHSKAKVSM